MDRMLAINKSTLKVEVVGVGDPKQWPDHIIVTKKEKELPPIDSHESGWLYDPKTGVVGERVAP